MATSDHFFSDCIECSSNISMGKQKVILGDSVYLIYAYKYNVTSISIVITVPEVLTAIVNSTTANSISLFWSVPSQSLVDTYEVMWERDISGERSYVDKDSCTISNDSTSYTITGLSDGTTYIITMAATNAAGTAVSNSFIQMTQKNSESLFV